MNVRKAILTFAAAAGLAALAPAAQGIIYPIRFDPDFDGPVFVDIHLVGGTSADPCPDGIDGLHDCTINLVSANVTVLPELPFAGCNYISGPVANIGTGDGGAGLNTMFVGGRITQFETIAIAMSLDGCPQAFLQFNFGNPETNPLFPGAATLTITQIIENQPVKTTLNSRFAVPEPGVLGLLFAALSAGWFARRRAVKA